MKLIIDIDENVYKAMKTEYLNSYPQFDGYDMCVMSKKVREGTPLKAELEEIKSEMQDYGCSFIIAKRSDLASAVSNCIRMVDKHIKEIEEK